MVKKNSRSAFLAKKQPEDACASSGQNVEKSSPAAIFSAETGFPCTLGAAGKTCKETLLRKASEADAHVVSFGTRVGGLRPSDTTYQVYRQFDWKAPVHSLVFYQTNICLRRFIVSASGA